MEPAAAVLLVLNAAQGPLHWTVIQDRALRQGYLDPFEIRDVRAAVLTALRSLKDQGAVERVGKGTYAIRDAAGAPGADRSEEP